MKLAQLRTSFSWMTYVIFGIAALLTHEAARASTYTATSGNWSVPGSWDTNPTSPTNAGDTAQYIGAAVSTVTVDSARTVGTLSLGGSSNISWTVTPTSALTLNQVDPGLGTATISNTNTSIGTTNALIVNTGTITLADDLLISNTGGSTAANGAIQIIGTVGGTGNVTFSSTAPFGTPTATVFPGAIRVQTADNTFVGNVLIQKGSTVFSRALSFGVATNAITLGQSGQGDAALLSTAGNLANPITVASGAGTLTLGTLSTSALTAYSGPITLNGNVNLTSPSATNAMTISGIISGAGGITKVGAGITALSGANTYSGDTTVSTGTLLSAGSIPDGPGKGNLIVASGAVFSLGTSNDGVNGLSGAGTVTSTSGTRTITVGNNNQTSTFNGIFTNGTGGLTKAGNGTFTLQSSAVSTYTGTTRLNYNGGKLLLDFANLGTPTNLINSGSLLQMSSGTLEIKGKSTGTTAQTFSALTMGVNVGHDNTILLSPNGGGGTSITLTSPTLIRIPGNALNFVVTGGTGGTFNWGTPNLNGSILGGYAIFQGNTWAVGNGSTITGLPTGSYVTTTTNGNTAANYLTTHDIDVDSSPVLDGGATINSLRFNAAAANTLTLQGTNIIGSGGLLVTSDVGNNLTTITGGTLAGNGGGSASTTNGSVISAADLIVHQLNTANILDISSVITNGTVGSGITALTKSGPGTLKLSSDNTYTGATFIANGKLLINSPNAIPHGSGNGNVSVNGILDLNGNSITVNDFDVRPAGTLTSGVAGNVTLTMGESNDTASFIFNPGATVQDGSGVLAINKIGTGTFQANAQVTYSGGTTLTAGTLSLGDSSTPTSGVVTSGPVGTGLLTLAGGTLNATAAGGVTLANALKTNGTATLDTVTGDSLTLNGPLTSTATTDVLNFGTNSGTLNLSGDISGYTGTFAINSSAGNNLQLTGTTAANSDGSNAKFVLSGTSSGSARTLRFGDVNNNTVKLGSLSGAGMINPLGNAPVPNFVVEVGNLNLNDVFSGSMVSGASTVMNYRKVGTGSLTFSGTNAYLGSTTVSSGTLIAGADVSSSTVAGVTIPATSVNTTTEELTLAGHGMVNGDRVTFTGTRPGGLAGTTFYYVVGATTNTFKVSTTFGGSAVNISSATTATFSQAGAFGAGNSAIVVGDGGTGNNDANLLTGGAFTVERAVTVTNTGSTGVASIGGLSAASSTFAGLVTLNRDLTVAQNTDGGTLNVTGGLTAGSAGTKTITFGSATVVPTFAPNGFLGAVNVATTGITDGGGTVAVNVAGGTVTFAANNTYSGNTTVSAGALNVTGSIANNNYGKVFIAAPDNTLVGNPILNRIVTASASYGGFGSTEVGGLGSTLELIAGTATNSTTLGMQWRLRLDTEKTPAEGGTPPPLGGNNGLVSDVVDLSGIGSDLYVLQMSYDETKLVNLETTLLDAQALYLGSYNTGSGSWKNTVLANTGNNATDDQQGFAGSFTAFQTAYGTTLTTYIGAWGVDTTSNVAWAVVNHNSEFAVVPEPGSLVMMLVGGLSVLVFRRKRGI